MTKRTILRGGKVFDGTTVREAELVIEGDRILEVGTGLDGDAELDVTGLTVLPGLIDCHVHVVFSGADRLRMMQEPFSYQFYAAARNLRALLDCGITSARDAGGADLGMKTALADGLIEGPELATAVTVLGQTGGHTDGLLPNGACLPLMQEHPGRPAMVVDGPDQMRVRVRELVRAGADVIKICTTGGVLSPGDDPGHAHFDAEELAVCVAEAARAGLRVMAHAQGTEGIKNALRAGVRSIEHGIYLDDEAIELLLDKQAWLVPTLLAPTALIEQIEAGAAMPDSVVDKAYEVLEIHRDSMRRAVAAGVPIAMGTDSGVFPHGDNLRELELLHGVSMAPDAVLRASTVRAAELLGRADEVGTIAPGFRADLVLLEGDPFDFTGYRSRVRAVFQRGEPVRPLA
ncbi:metal-dependent hydrolase family protein [Sciscionella sediminilitoris]|uniref:metal-dependent hydrolase family protein n=1 Tax=Sciscionella sediminilitoris TaxID=1445613 RepID=UPI0004DF2C19|nr:amidohydrolase family protein [Sciscionella sp. SE31]